MLHGFVDYVQERGRLEILLNSRNYSKLQKKKGVSQRMIYSSKDTTNSKHNKYSKTSDNEQLTVS